MEAFTIHSGKVAPMDRANVDTDLIIPKQFLKSVKRTGFGPNLFDPLRYLDEGQPGKDNSKRPTNPEFFLNQPRYRQSTILLARDNFGCGSSREHAPWALMDYGFRVVLAPSFADIFYNNCFKNGLLPIVLPADVIDQLFSKVTAGEIVEATVDLPHQQITAGTGMIIEFAIEDFRKECLVKGLDDIDLTLEKADLIKAYEAKRKEVCPWLFEDLA